MNYLKLADDLRSPASREKVIKQLSEFSNKEALELSSFLGSEVRRIESRWVALIGISVALGFVLLALSANQLLSKHMLVIGILVLVLLPLALFASLFSRITVNVRRLREALLFVDSPAILGFLLDSIRSEDPVLFSGMDKEDLLASFWSRVAVIVQKDVAYIADLSPQNRKLLVTYSAAVSKLGSKSSWQTALLAAVRLSGQNWMTVEEKHRFSPAFWN